MINFFKKRKILKCIDIQNVFLDEKVKKLLKIIEENNFYMRNFYFLNNGTIIMTCESKDLKVDFTIIDKKCCKCKTIYYNNNVDKNQFNQIKFAFKTFDFSVFSFPNVHDYFKCKNIYDVYFENYLDCNKKEILEKFGIQELKHPTELFGEMFFD